MEPDPDYWAHFHYGLLSWNSDLRRIFNSLRFAFVPHSKKKLKCLRIWINILSYQFHNNFLWTQDWKSCKIFQAYLASNPRNTTVFNWLCLCFSFHLEIASSLSLSISHRLRSDFKNTQLTILDLRSLSSAHYPPFITNTNTNTNRCLFRLIRTKEWMNGVMNGMIANVIHSSIIIFNRE